MQIFCVVYCNHIQTAKIAIETSFSTICEWMKDSGLKINEAMTEVCVFLRGDTATIIISVNGINVRTRTEINVLGVLFDSKLQWANHVQNAITHANGTLNPIKLLRKFFPKCELCRVRTILQLKSKLYQL